MIGVTMNLQYDIQKGTVVLGCMAVPFCIDE
jgi:hypothetical protein